MQYIKEYIFILKLLTYFTSQSRNSTNSIKIKIYVYLIQLNWIYEILKKSVSKLIFLNEKKNTIDEQNKIINTTSERYKASSKSHI